MQPQKLGRGSVQQCNQTLREVGVQWALVLALALVFGCGPDDDDPSPDDDDTAADDDDTSPDDDDVTTDDDDATEAAVGSVVGVVRAVGGDPIAGVLVRVGERQVASGADGRFELTEVEVSERAVLRARRRGWSTAFQAVEVVEGRSTQVQIFLAPAFELELPDASEVGSVEFEIEVSPDGSIDPEDAVFASADGFSIEFVDGTFTDPDGAAVTGAVSVDVTVLNTSGSLLAAPGSMQGLDDDGAVVDLESFGMAEVLLSQGEIPVAFSGTAILSIPLVEGSDVEDGASIGLWSFDEELGYWIVEGTGTVSDSAFVATVTHFTWWNADMPLDETSCFEGTVEGVDGAPVPDMPLDSWGLTYLGSSSTTTGDDGTFCLPVKLGSLGQLTGTIVIDGATYGVTAVLDAPDLAGDCTSGECTDLGTLVLNPLGEDDDGDGLSEDEGDCDDLDFTVGPGLPDPLGDGIDTDCDGVDGVDGDGDGWAGGDGGEDCDDTNPGVRPDALEWCNDLDDDCDGLIDGSSAIDAVLAWIDGDGDGFGDLGSPVVVCDAAAAGFSDDPTDCDDGDGSVYPGAPEACDGLDHDCDGETMEADSVDTSAFYVDFDGDGWGDADSPVLACVAPSGTVAPEAIGDCDDTSPAVSPDGVETCNGVDDDCNGDTDEGSPSNGTVFYVDADLDGFGTDDSTVVACTAAPGQAVLGGDCDDADPSINPGAAESGADDVDLNCDGSVAFADVDGDGVAACEDCDDTDPAFAPGAVESCDLLDSDCDGTLADFYADLDGDDLPDCVDPDDDGDGDPDVTDCGPLDPALGAGATEFCDTIDQDCDGDLLEAFDDLDGDAEPDCIDADDDGDGWDDVDDCAPTDPAISPGADEVCDGVDNDCDGSPDACELVAADAVAYGDGVGHVLSTALASGDFDGNGISDLVFGSPGSSVSAPFAGAVHVVAGPVPAAISLASATATWTGVAEEDAAGQSVAACDVDGDGVDDLVVGAWAADTSAGLASGTAYLQYGPLSGTSSLADAHVIIEGEAPGDWLGWSVACGDFNGDGAGDVALGAYRSDLGGTDAGAVYVFEGPIATGTLSAASADSIVTGEVSYDHAGYSVASAGDVDGLGTDDLLVGAWGADGVGLGAGAAYLVVGPLTTGTTSLGSATAKLLGVEPGGRAGWSVTGVEDTNGDGRAELAVGAYAASSDTGSVYVVYGGVTGDLTLDLADAVLEGDVVDTKLGWAVAGAGDVDGDGSGDLLVGVPGADLAGSNSGQALLFEGPLVGTLGPDQAQGVYPGTLPGDQVGYTVTGAGDTDDDGLDDILMGAPFNDDLLGDAGAAWLFLDGGLGP